MNDKANIAFTLSDIGYCYFKMKDYTNAKKYGIEGYDLAKKMNFPENIRNSANLMYKLYKEIHNTSGALEMFEVWVKLKDSLRNKETERATIKSKFSYEYKTKSLTDSISNAKQIEVKNAELATKAAEIKAKRNLQVVLFIGLTLVIVFAIFIFNRFKVTQRQKNIIEIKEQEAQKQNQIIMEQKHLVEEKQKEILDSIHYAKRIQRALLAKESYIGKTINRLTKK